MLYDMNNTFRNTVFYIYVNVPLSKPFKIYHSEEIAYALLDIMKIPTGKSFHFAVAA